MASHYGLKNIDNLLDVQAVYTADLTESIYTIRKKYGKHIKEPPPGIYWVDGIKPIITPDDKVYRQSDYQEQRSFDIQQLEHLDEPLLDKDANTLLSKGVIQNKDMFLRLKPNLDVRVMEIIAIIVKNTISNLVLHNAYETSLVELKEHLKPSGYHLVESMALQELCKTLIEEVDYFVGHHQWNIYSTQLEHTRIHVCRCVDYRVMDWTRRMANGEWNDTHPE